VLGPDVIRLVASWIRALVATSPSASAGRATAFTIAVVRWEARLRQRNRAWNHTPGVAESLPRSTQIHGSPAASYLRLARFHIEKRTRARTQAIISAFPRPAFGLSRGSGAASRRWHPPAASCRPTGQHFP